MLNDVVGKKNNNVREVKWRWSATVWPRASKINGNPAGNDSVIGQRTQWQPEPRNDRSTPLRWHVTLCACAAGPKRLMSLSAAAKTCNRRQPTEADAAKYGSVYPCHDSATESVVSQTQSECRFQHARGRLRRIGSHRKALLRNNRQTPSNLRTSAGAFSHNTADPDARLWKEGKPIRFSASPQDETSKTRDSRLPWEATTESKEWKAFRAHRAEAQRDSQAQRSRNEATAFAPIDSSDTTTKHSRAWLRTDDGALGRPFQFERSSPQADCAVPKPGSVYGSNREPSLIFEDIPVDTPFGFPIQGPHNMVNERDQGHALSALYVPKPSTDKHSGLSATTLNSQKAPTLGQHTQVEFGKASPLRNPLSANKNVFNSNQNRPEHHRVQYPSLQPGGLRQPNPVPLFQPTGAPRPVANGPAVRNGFSLPGQQRQAVPQPSPGATIGADFFEVSAPINPTYKTIQPAPRPTFSSIGPKTTYQPFKPVSRVTIDLTKDNTGYDPNAALREHEFGSVDPYAYVDPLKASESIKALLEGAFEDDDDEKPKYRLRKRARKPTKEDVDTKTNSLAAKLAKLEVQDSEQGSSPLVNDDEDDDEEEDGTVEGMTVKLLPHQVEGVKWMVDKEIGERKKGVLPKGGILADDMGLGKTIQSVTLILTNARPASDAKSDNPKRKLPGNEVGKGTLVVAPLALIKQWEAEIKTKVEQSHALRVLVHHGPSRTKSHLELKKYDVVITTYQILASEHAGSSDHPDGLKVGCFGVHWYRVILDEAHSIKNRNAKSTQACYALRSWYRWCLTGTPMQNNLDELQSLIHFLQIKPYDELSFWKNHITGPMKNGKGQYAIKRIQYFLQACMKRRTKDILKKDGALNFGGKGKEGAAKGESMQIVERKVETIICELDAGERAFYDRLAERANDRLNDMMAGEKADYIGALVLLLRLRQACNDPQLIESAIKKDKDALATAGLGNNQSPRKGSANTDGDVDDLADLLGGMDVANKNCDVCQVVLDPRETKSGAVRCSECEEDLAARKRNNRHHKSAKSKAASRAKADTNKIVLRLRNNRKIVHDSDDEDGEGGGEWLVPQSSSTSGGLGRAGGTDDEDAEGGGHTLGSLDSETDDDDREDRSSRAKREPTDPTSLEDSSSGTESDDVSSSESDIPTSRSSTSRRAPASTKIRRLLRILHADSGTHKVIVFSQFTSMLDLIEPHLQHASIRYVRYDGGMRNDAREASLHSLRNDKRTRVLLCSLKCGSLGLNLTAASRVVIVEPFWNPFVEEQAIDRVHRLNQTRDVRVYKLTVANTVEERILELQEKKRQLANAAIEGGKAMAKLSMKDLLGLFGNNPETAVDVDAKWNAPESGGLFKPVAGKAPANVSAPRDKRRFEKPKSRISNEDPVYGRR